jgi:predicted hydrocarbon binding protein
MSTNPDITNHGFRMFLTGIGEILGPSGLTAILQKAGLSQFVNHLPPDDKNFSGIKASFGGRLEQAFLDEYGTRQSRVMLYQVGRNQTQKMFQDFGAVMGAAGLAMKLIPRRQKIRFMLDGGARQLVALGMSASVHEENNLVCLDVAECYQCEGVKSDSPVCHVTRGQIDAFLEWALGSRAFKLQEILCKAKGDPVCRFVVEEAETAAAVESA